MGLELLTSQGINPSVIQQAAALQMNAQELEQYMKELAQENPMVELEEPEALPPEQEDTYLRKLEWLARTDEQNRFYYTQEYGDGRENGLYNTAAPEGRLLRDELLSQLVGGHYTRRQMEAFVYIAHSLDERGYFTDPLEEAAEQLGVDPGFFAQCLHIMQHLQPEGVCARNLTECLLLQLEQRSPRRTMSRNAPL